MWLVTLGGLVALFVVGYAVVISRTWLRFGRGAAGRDALLDRFLPEYDIVEHHSIVVSAPAETTFHAASNVSINDSAVVRALIRIRAAAMGVFHQSELPRRPLVEDSKDLGWGVLAEDPGRELVMGSVTQPWLGQVVFQPQPPDAFRAYAEPEHVKIAWTLRVEPAGEAQCVFHTETRACATDELARRKFRRYWSFIAPGVVLIRWVTLRAVRRAAIRQARKVHS